MIFILSLLALAVCFYAYAFVNFQKEIARIRHENSAGAVTISLPVEDSGENEPEESSRPPQELYQVESPYLGPLFLVPRRRESVNRTARAAHGRLVSAMYATATGPARREAVAGSTRVDGAHRNVIQITTHVPAHN